jgi:phage shock protein E
MTIRSVCMNMAAFFGLTSCFAAGGPEKISPDKARALLSGSPQYILVDVRTPAEYEAGHIPGAVLIPNETITTTRPQQLPDVNAPVIVYCRSGRRSADAARKLTAMGYTAVFDLGGIIDWPYATVKGSEPGKF